MHCKHPTERPNFVIISLPDCDLAFSYETLIGVKTYLRSSHPVPHGPLNPNPHGVYRFRQWLLAENTWGPTTGKHLNYLDEDKEYRVPQRVVEQVAVQAISGEALLTDLYTAHDKAIEAFT